MEKEKTSCSCLEKLSFHYSMVFHMVALSETFYKDLLF